MIECLWSCLLVLASLNRTTRPLAFLLGAKAALCYALALSGFWTAPALIDVGAGTVGVVLALRLPQQRIGAILAASFVVAPLIHAWHWGLWANGVYVGVQYYWVMLGLFSAQVLALALPEAQDIVRTFRHNRRLARRRALVGVGAAGRRGGASRGRG